MPVTRSIRIDTVAGRCPTIDAVAAADPAGHPFLRGAWYGDAEDDTIRTLVARRMCGQPLVAIPTAPLGPAALGARSVPGSYWPFRSVAVAPDADTDELAHLFDDRAAAATLGGVWRLGPVPVDDSGASRIVAAARTAGWSVLERTAGTSFILDLSDGAWPSRSNRRRVAGYERRLAQDVGPVTIRTITGEDWSPTVIATLHAIEADSWVARDTDGSGAKFASDAQQRCWLAKLADPVIARALSATILTAGDTAIAYSFDLTAGSRQYAIATNYREGFAAYRPGRIVTLHQLTGAIAAGVTTIDLGVGDSGYKQEMGARAGPRMVDYLFVRHGVAAKLLAQRWRDPPDVERRSRVRPVMPWLAATLATAGAVAFMAD